MSDVATVSPRAAAPRPGRFWRLWTASSLSNLGDGLYQFALPLLALEITRSPSLVSGVTLMLTLAWPVFGLHAGSVVDRFDRRNVLLGVSVLRVVTFGPAHRRDRQRATHARDAVSRGPRLGDRRDAGRHGPDGARPRNGRARSARLGERTHHRRPDDHQHVPRTAAGWSPAGDRGRPRDGRRDLALRPGRGQSRDADRDSADAGSRDRRAAGVGRHRRVPVPVADADDPCPHVVHRRDERVVGDILRPVRPVRGHPRSARTLARGVRHAHRRDVDRRHRRVAVGGANQPGDRHQERPSDRPRRDGPAARRPGADHESVARRRRERRRGHRERGSGSSSFPRSASESRRTRC